MGAAFRALRISALRYPLMEGRKGSKPTIWTEARRDVAARQRSPSAPQIHGRNHDAVVFGETEPKVCDVKPRLLRFARNDEDGLVEAVIARSA